MNKLILIVILSSLGACASLQAGFERGQNMGNQFWGGMVEGMARQQREEKRAPDTYCPLGNDEWGFSQCAQ
jgi:hypothetical protein